jgi:hypothetical protein
MGSAWASPFRDNTLFPLTKIGKGKNLSLSQTKEEIDILSCFNGHRRFIAT